MDVETQDKQKKHATESAADLEKVTGDCCLSFVYLSQYHNTYIQLFKIIMCLNSFKFPLFQHVSYLSCANY